MAPFVAKQRYSASSVNVDTRQRIVADNNKVAVFGYNKVEHQSTSTIHNKVHIQQQSLLLNANFNKGILSFVEGFCLLLESVP